jgi:hypothetical protein
MERLSPVPFLEKARKRYVLPGVRPVKVVLPEAPVLTVWSPVYVPPFSLRCAIRASTGSPPLFVEAPTATVTEVPTWLEIVIEAGAVGTPAVVLEALSVPSPSEDTALVWTLYSWLASTVAVATRSVPMETHAPQVLPALLLRR